MGHRAVRMGMMLWLAGCISQAVCQSAAAAAPQPPERASYGAYENFLRQVAARKDAPIEGPGLLNGDPVKPALPDVRDVAGLTEQDVQRLREIAVDCEAKTESLDRISRPLTFEYLLESIESGQDNSSSLKQRLQELADEREQVVRDHVGQIKTALGDSRFEKLDAFVHDPNPGAPRTAPTKKR